MKRDLTATHVVLWAIGSLAALGCEGNDDVARPDSSVAIMTGSGGTTTASGSGGSSGGTTGSGGTTATGKGGTTGTGGATSAGGTTGAGGSTATGGRGGTVGTGGTTGSGGVLGTGGTTGTGGRVGTGGTPATGGTTGAGGVQGSGGSPATGGSAGSTSCGALSPTANGNGEYTFYNFGQGTAAAQEGGGFRTACGYFGTETSGNTSDMVQNITNAQYFAAIPGTDSQHFNTNNDCGACAQVTYASNGRSLIVTIIDECPENVNAVCKANPTGELDLSIPAATALGFGPNSGQNGNPTGQSWKIVPCPITGNIKVRVKTGNVNEVFIENTILAIKSVAVNGAQATHSFYGTWQLPVTAAANQTLTLTDAANRTLTIPVTGAGPNVNQDTGKQFPACQ